MNCTISDFDLRVRTVDDADCRAAFDAMERAVFGTVDAAPTMYPPVWTSIGLFDQQGRCLAGAKFADLSVVIDGHCIEARGFRRIGVIEPWRGRGLFRRLMQHLVAEVEARGTRLALLYAETASLYERYGFVGVAQHTFSGPAPVVTATTPARRFDPVRDRHDLDRLLAVRTPVSRQVALTGAPGLVTSALAADPDFELAYLDEDDTLLVYEREGDAVVLVDIVAAVLPSMARIVAALPQPIFRITTLFAPDRLEWEGTPMPDDTGLMARGPLPPAMRRPFRLPPTTEF